MTDALSILLPIGIIFSLIFLNGLFVAAEFAIIAIPRPTLENAAEEGDLGARKILTILTDPLRQDRFIATAQVGITFASLGLGMYGEHVLAVWIGTWLSGWNFEPFTTLMATHSAASVLSISLLTYVHIVVGEMIPKSLAIESSWRTAARILPVMILFQALMYPLVLLLNAAGNGILKIFGIQRTEMSAEHYRTPEELAYLIRESELGGKIDAGSAEVLRELLEFGDLRAAEVMVPRTKLVGLPLKADHIEIRDLLRSNPHSRYPVYEDDLDQIIGVVHVKDLLRRLSDDHPIKASVVRPVPFIPASSTLEQVLLMMNSARSQMVVVIDEQGGTAGLISIEDLFEEVVGEIQENQATVPEIFRDEAGQLHVRGTARVTDVGVKMGKVIEHPLVDTVSGLVLHQLGRPAQTGDAVDYGGLLFKVVSTKGRGVDACIVSAAPAAVPSEKLP